MYQHDRINVLINGSGLLAESASLNSSNQLSPNYQIGKRGIASITASGPIKNVFNFSYTPKLDYDSAFIDCSGLKDLVNDLYFTGSIIEFGGITGYNCYLQSYSLHAEPNVLVKAQASYISFNELSGTLLPKKAIPTMNEANAIAWGPTVYITTQTGYYLTPVFSFDYNFQADFEPIYTFGRAFPSQINFMGASENMTFIRDNFIKVYFTGKDAYNNEANSYIVNSGTEDPFINMLDIAFTCNTGLEERFPSFVFNISGAKITNSEMNVRVDDYLKSTTTIVNYY